MSAICEIRRPFQDALRRELAQGERLQWAEQPVQRFFGPESTTAFILGIPWTAFAIFWVCSAPGIKLAELSKESLGFFPLGLPFLLIGIGMLSAPVWEHRRGLRSLYVITDRRAITFERGWKTTVRSYMPVQIKNMVRRDKKDGTGDVVLGQRLWTCADYRRLRDVGFLRVRDPRRTEQMLGKLIEPSAGPSASGGG